MRYEGVQLIFNVQERSFANLSSSHSLPAKTKTELPSALLRALINRARGTSRGWPRRTTSSTNCGGGGRRGAFPRAVRHERVLRLGMLRPPAVGRRTCTRTAVAIFQRRRGWGVSALPRGITWTVCVFVFVCVLSSGCLVCRPCPTCVCAVCRLCAGVGTPLRRVKHINRAQPP